MNRAAAESVANAARARAPRISGKLASTVRVGVTQYGASVRVGGPKVPYAPPIHWGWPGHNIQPQPFLYNALDEMRPEIIARYERDINALIRRVMSGGGE